MFVPKTRTSRYCSHRCSCHAYEQRFPERRKEASRKHWEKVRADPERYARFLAQGRASYRRHPETAYLYALNWRADNRERLRAKLRKDAAKRRALVGGRNREASDYVRILRSDPCSYCGRESSVIDHIDALASGGEHRWDNLTAACRSCNARKRTRPLLTFLLAIHPSPVLGGSAC